MSAPVGVAVHHNQAVAGGVDHVVKVLLGHLQSTMWAGAAWEGVSGARAPAPRAAGIHQRRRLHASGPASHSTPHLLQLLAGHWRLGGDRCSIAGSCSWQRSRAGTGAGSVSRVAAAPAVAASPRPGPWWQPRSGHQARRIAVQHTATSAARQRACRHALGASPVAPGRLEASRCLLSPALNSCIFFSSASREARTGSAWRRGAGRAASAWQRARLRRGRQKVPVSRASVSGQPQPHERALPHLCVEHTTAFIWRGWELRCYNWEAAG